MLKFDSFPPFRLWSSMPLSPPVSRQLRHRRAIRLEAFERNEALWDIEACLTDEKPRDVQLASGVRPNGLPIHELWLRITIDRQLTIVDAEASSEWAPSPMVRIASLSVSICSGIFDATPTHCCAVRPAARISPSCAPFCRPPRSRPFASEVWNIEDGNPFTSRTQSNDTQERPPFQLGQCHALRFDGPAVREFHPRWVDLFARGHTQDRPDK